MTEYMLCDGDDNQLAILPDDEDRALESAARHATRLGRTLYVSCPDGKTYEVAPEE